MATVSIPTAPTQLSPAALQPSLKPAIPSQTLIKAPKKHLKPTDTPFSKSEGTGKPKQSKSRNGCITCKTKRLKCDETKPSCWQCYKRKVECGGYKKDFKWRAFEESTFTTRPIPSPDTSRATAQPWPLAGRSLASAVVSTAIAVDPRQAVPFLSGGSNPLDKTGHSGLTSLQGDCALCFRTSMSPGTPIPQHNHSAVRRHAAYGPITYEENQREHQKFYDCLSMCRSPNLHLELHGEWTKFPQSASSASSSPQGMYQYLPGLDSSIDNMDLVCTHRPSNALRFRVDEAQPRIEELKDNSIEDSSRQANNAKDRQLHLASPANSHTSSSSEDSTFHLSNVCGFPRFSSRSPEMMVIRFDRQTCGILSVKDGPTENPWRTMIWPLAQDSPALYHAIVSMTAFHTARNEGNIRVAGVDHMRQSITYLASGITDGNIRLDAALATTLALAFSESWDRHISTGIQHLRGAKTMVDQALIEHEKNSLTPEEVGRLRFLCNTWIYMVVIARLTSVDDDECNDFEYALNAPIDSFEAKHEVDPLMGCASTLFPLIGRVANLVRRVRNSAKNSINMIEEANELKNAAEAWEPPEFFKAPEDHSLNIQHSLDTAEAYRWATLLYLHQAVPEIPSRSCEELAGKVIVYLLKVPLTSRAVIIQIYPLLAASCEVTSHEDRAWVEGRWIAMMQRMWIGNLDKCWEVVKEVWKRRDTNASDNPRQSSGYGISEEVQGAFSFDNALLGDGPFSGMRRKPQSVSDPLSMPSQVRRRRLSETMEDIEYGRTVRGAMHWIGVMKEWRWEILLG